MLVPSGSPLFTTASEFLGAFLARQGDVARIISPDTAIRAVAPAPYPEVSVSGIAAHSDVPSTPRDGDKLDVLVTASAASGDHQAVTVQYPLTLALRAGRWEVAAIRDVPLTSVKQPQGSAMPTLAPVETLTPSSTPTTPSATSTRQ